MVYVVSIEGRPLMPTNNAKARILLKSKKAKCIKRTPFTIKLTYKTKEYTQFLTLGIDTGSSKIGSAVVNEIGNVLYMSEVEIRNDIKEKMDRRRMYRRNRRNRKTRYRKPRWLNRKNSIKKDRFSPTMTSKIQSHLKEIKFVNSILPIKSLILETATFDAHALKNPEVLNKKWLYQKGVNYGFANTKAFVLNRDKYTCQNCKTKKGTMEVHHIIYRSNNGSDNEDNLITLCSDCHYKLHHGEVKLKKKGSKKSNLNHATQMNSIRVQLLKQLDCTETFGCITKEHRYLLNLPKEHYFDAVAIANLYNMNGENLQSVVFKYDKLLKKKCVPYRDIQKTKGVRSEQKIPTGKIQGFRKFDKVKYLDSIYFIKGRMSSGYAILMDISGTKIQLKPTPKFSKMKRISGRKNWITIEEEVINIG